MASIIEQARATFFMVEELRVHVSQPYSISQSTAATGCPYVTLCTHSNLFIHRRQLFLKIFMVSANTGFQGLNIIASRRPKTFSGEVFDADLIGSTATLRHWRKGDRFQPIGKNSASKLKKLFINAKISNIKKRSAVLGVTTDGEIFWVEGLRIGEWAKVNHDTQRLLLWKWSKI